MITLILQSLIMVLFFVCFLQFIKIIKMIKSNDYDEKNDPEYHGKIYIGDKEITSKQAMNIIREDSKK